MKVVLFCGGKGTRIRAASESTPKPLLDVAGIPIITRLMARYSSIGATEFILAGGYKIEFIEKYFKSLISSVNTQKLDRFLQEKYDAKPINEWSINIVDTGECNIGTRLYKLKDYLMKEKTFLVNYSDSISDIDLQQSIKVIANNDSIAAIFSVKPSQYYHWLEFDNDHATSESSTISNISSSSLLKHKINGGYMCLKPEIFNYMNFGEELVEEPFNRLIQEKKLLGYNASGYWKSIDTYKDLIEAESELHEKGLNYEDV